MPDDIFKLGNFSDDLDDIEEIQGAASSPSETLTHRISGSPSPAAAGEGNKESIIRHPTVKSDPQAKFRTRDGKALLEIELEKIVPNEYQPRRIFNPEKLQELADSIREHGIIQPIVVVERENDKYEIIVGERRFRASQIAGLAKIPAYINPGLEAEAKLELALIENIQRADLNPIEEAKAFQRLQQEFNLTVGQIAKKVGKDDSTVSNLIRLLNLPIEIQRALIEEKIAEGQARPLLSLKDHEEMLQMFKIIMQDNMKVRDIESKVREIKKRGIKVKDMFTPDPLLSSLENILRSKLGTRVEVNRSAKGGKITIEFFSDEELNDIVNKIS